VPALPPPPEIPAGAPERFLREARETLAGLARRDGDFALNALEAEADAEPPGSDLDATAFAVLLHRMLGWPPPFEGRARLRLLGLQRPDGSFPCRVSRWGAGSPQAALYTASQALRALHALETPPRVDPLPVVAAAARAIDAADWKHPFTSCVLLTHQVAGRPLPLDLAHLLRARLPAPEERRRKNDWIVDAPHALRFHRLLNEPIPDADGLVDGALRVFERLHEATNQGHSRETVLCAVLYVLGQLGSGRPDVRRALAEAPARLLADGPWKDAREGSGFDQYTRHPCWAESAYYHAVVLRLAGLLEGAPVDPLWDGGPERLSRRLSA
jgi:hypothetical protein